MGRIIAMGVLVLIAVLLALMAYGIYTSRIYITP
jgi:hypothetical protein